MSTEQKVNVVIDATDKASKKIQTFGDKMSKTLKKVGIGALAIGTAVTAFSIKAIKDFGNLGEQLDNFSKSSGLSVKSASALKYQLDSMGLGMESAVVAIKKMQDGIYQASDGNKALADSFKNLGMKLSDLKSQSPEEQFFALGNAIAQIKDPAEKTAMAMDIFGKSGADMIPLFKDGKISLQDFITEAEKMGVVMDESSLKSALAVDEAMDRMAGAWQGFKMTLAGILAPLAVSVLEWATNTFQGIRDKMSTFNFDWKGGWDTAKSTVQSAWLDLTTWIDTDVKPYFDRIREALGNFQIDWGIAWETMKLSFSIIWEAIKFTINTILAIVSGVIESLVALSNGDWKGAWEGFKKVFTGIWESLSTYIGGIQEKVMGWINAILEKLGLANTEAGKLDRTASSGTGSGKGGGGGGAWSAQKISGFKQNAQGGSVYAGVPSIVGERGAELFVPRSNGSIIPNDRLGGTVINITGIFGKGAVEEIGDELAKMYALHSAY